MFYEEFEFTCTSKCLKFNLICSSCGYPIISSGNFYTCGQYNSSGKKACGCGYFAVPAEWLEEKVIKDIMKLLDDKLLNKAYKDFTEGLLKSTSQKDGKAAELEKAIFKKQKEIDNLLESLKTIASVGNQIALKTISNEIEKLGGEKALLDKELEDCKKTKLIKIPSFNEFKKQMDIAKALSSPENIVQRRQIIWTFVSSITLDPSDKSVSITYFKNPFEVLFNVSKIPQNPSYKKPEALKGTSSQLVAEAGFEPTTFGL